jgi:hypothetical protein
MPSVLTNVDLVCLGVEYMAVTRAFNGLELLGPTPRRNPGYGDSSWASD